MLHHKALILGFLATLVPMMAFAEIISVGGKSSPKFTSDNAVTIIRGAPQRCDSGPAIIHAGEAQKPVRCAVENKHHKRHHQHDLSIGVIVLADHHAGLYIPLN